MANTTLMFERTSLGAGGGSAAASLATRAPWPATSNGAPATSSPPAGAGAGAAGRCSAPRRRCSPGSRRRNGKAKDPSVRQRLMQLHTIGEVARFNNLRLKAAKAAGRDIPGLPNIAKLTMSNIVRLSRDLGLEITGAYGTLHAYDGDARKALDEATGMPFLRGHRDGAVRPGPSHLRRHRPGPAQHHRRACSGLPKEPGFDKNTPFKDLPKNG